MDYTPRFSQPFTLQEAIGLDVAVINEEIARLRNSITHLEETQNILQADLHEPGESDPEILKAFEENQVVIGSQKERIAILKMALSEKGVVGGSHYDPTSSTPITPSQTRTTATEPPGTFISTMTADNDDGVYL